MGSYPPAALSYAIIGAAMKVHSRLGPGFLEAVYESALMVELEQRSLAVERQVSFPVYYNGTPLSTGMRIDLLVAGSVIVEVKALERVLAIHKAQCLSYLRASGLHLALLINFNVVHLNMGLKRIIN